MFHLINKSFPPLSLAVSNHGYIKNSLLYDHDALFFFSLLLFVLGLAFPFKLKEYIWYSPFLLQLKQPSTVLSKDSMVLVIEVCQMILLSVMSPYYHKNPLAPCLRAHSVENLCTNVKPSHVCLEHVKHVTQSISRKTYQHPQMSVLNSILKLGFILPSGGAGCQGKYCGRRRKWEISWDVNWPQETMVLLHDLECTFDMQRIEKQKSHSVYKSCIQ